MNSVAFRLTKILGIIVRSSSVRNAFEFYHPFLSLSRKLLDVNCHLILSSEWDYIPFTFPQTIQDLPNFVIIGLPASESDNVLIFPAAGHELGHSIWRKEELRKKLSSQVKEEVLSSYKDSLARFEKLFPEHKSVDLENDLFAQNLISDSTLYSLLHCEEVFADAIGLLIFGTSYLHAYEYLLSPTLGGDRSTDYPENRQRAKILREFSELLGIEVSTLYELSFTEDQGIQNPYERFILDMADVATLHLLPQVLQAAKTHVISRGVLTPDRQTVKDVLRFFERGVPFSKQVGIGSLISAAWAYFGNGHTTGEKNLGRDKVDLINDLVLKSAEIAEYAEHLK